MRNTGGGTPHQLVIQSWIMYSIGMFLVVLRMLVRGYRLGWGKLQLDDYVMMTAAGWYTAFIITNIQIAVGGGSSLYEPGQFSTFSPEDIKVREYGSKVELASEQCMLNVIYTIKVCMLFIYARLTLNLKQQRYVRAAAVYVFIGWLTTQLVFFLNCRPFHNYWVLPPPQPECASYFNYSVTQAVFNISSDVLILLIVLPMILRTHMPLKTKLPIIIILSMGSFIIIAAVLTKIFTFHNVYDTSYQFWYLREASVAVYVSNLPLIWPFLRQIASSLRSVDFSTKGDPSKGTDESCPSGTFRSGKSNDRGMSLSYIAKKARRPTGRLEQGLQTTRNDSSEFIRLAGELEMGKNQSSEVVSELNAQPNEGNIKKETEFKVENTFGKPSEDSGNSSEELKPFDWGNKQSYRYKYDIQGGTESPV